MFNTTIPPQWGTPHLTVVNSTADHLPGLQQVYDACRYIDAWMGRTTVVQQEHPMQTILRDGDIPPHGTKERYRLQSIQYTSTNQLIGYLAVYHGYPLATILWVATLMIDPPFQHHGYGQEIITGLSDVVRQCGQFPSMRLGVGLKNWPALRFWTRCGFERIVAIDGDAVYSANASAFVTLEKRLRADETDSAAQKTLQPNSVHNSCEIKRG